MLKISSRFTAEQPYQSHTKCFAAILKSYFGIVFACKFSAYIQNTFPKNTSGWLILEVFWSCPILFDFLTFCQIICIRFTAQNMMFSIKDLFSKCDQIRGFLQIWSHLLKKYFMENFIFCAVIVVLHSSN